MRGVPPRIRAALFAAILRRPAGSLLRQRVFTGAVRVGFDLLDRREDRGVVDQILRFYDPACEIHVGAGFPIDLDPVYHGHAGWRALSRAWDEAGAMSYVAEEALDMGGPCFAILVAVRLTGTESRVAVPPVQSVWTYTLRRGLIVRQDVRNDGWDAAPEELAAAVQRRTPATEEPSSAPA